MTPRAEFVELDRAGRSVRVECQRVGPVDPARPLVVFLHEGLGSVSMWRGFPQAFCDAVPSRGLVYSRPGYGRSTPRDAGECWRPDFMHRQAHDVLPALLRTLQIEEPVWLFGHSDGGTIALLFAAAFPQATAGLIVLAPHIKVEPMSLASIRAARAAYATGALKARLARHHDDPDSAFHGWNRAWLDPEFEQWSIEGEIAAIRCPVLAVQGVDDEYGTLEQIRGIARRVTLTELLELPGCGHSPQRDRAADVIAAGAAFMHRHTRASAERHDTTPDPEDTKARRN